MLASFGYERKLNNSKEQKMPIHKTKSGGWKWGKSGKVYKTRAGAERQARAIYSSGWREKKD